VSALQTVHVRVNDAATGQPTPALIRFTGPDGTYYAPFGRLTDFATGRGENVGGSLLLGSQRYAYIDGTCEIRLPVGPITVEVRKDGEHRPLIQQLALGPGKMALRLSLERWTNARQEGWYAGDTQAFFLTPHAALLEAAADDLAVVNLLVCAVGDPLHPAALPNLLAFSGQRPSLERPGHMVVVNTLNEHPALGRLALLNCHRVVYPLAFGGLHGFDDWTLADWCDQCHRKGGLVVAADFFSNQRWRRGEVVADLILGKIDALAMTPLASPGFGLTTDLLEPWYQLLNAGLRVAVVGGSGKDSNTRQLGSVRTYARLLPGEELTYQCWIEAVRAGRTFWTVISHVLYLTVEGQEVGSVIQLTPGAETVHVRAEVKGLHLGGRLEVVGNGMVIVGAQRPAGSVLQPGETTEEADTISLEMDVPLAPGGWLAARYVIPAAAGLPDMLWAHTSPVYVRVDGSAAPTNTAALAFLRNHLDDMLAWVDRNGHYENDQQKQRLAGIFQSAKDTLANPPAV
jgi:hypothetical protein